MARPGTRVPGCPASGLRQPRATEPLVARRPFMRWLAPLCYTPMREVVSRLCRAGARAMRHYLPILLLALTAAPTVQAATYTVAPDGSGDFPTIQAAVDAVQHGDIIQLADGTFTGAGNHDVDYRGKNITIASQGGNAQQCIVDCEHRGRGFVFQSNEGPQAILMDVMITRGYANEVSSPPGRGGAVACRGSTPTIERCVLYDNTAMEAGGAIYCSSGNITLAGCRFEWNRTAIGPGRWGGAIACWRSSADLYDCTFYLNTAVSGGDLCLKYGSSAAVSECSLVWSAGLGAGPGIFCESSSLLVDGSSLCISGIAVAGGSEAFLANTIVAFALQEPGVRCEDPSSSVTLTCCDVFGNHGGDWVGCIETQLGVRGNLCVDPLFCDPEVLDFTLQSVSPCAQGNNPVCGQIGALPVGCGSTPALPMSWGRLKALFRMSAERPTSP